MNLVSTMRIRVAISILLACLLAVSLFPASLQPVQASSIPKVTAYVPGELVLGLADSASIISLALPEGAALAETPSEIADQLNTFLITVPAGQEERIRGELLASPQVLFVEFNSLVRALLIPNDPLWPPGVTPPATSLGQYGPVHVNAPDAWDLTTGSAGITIAIVDSGIDTGHPEFSGRLASGYDFIDNDNTPRDSCGHGTHVTGIAAATGNNSRGIAGIDWGARIMPVRVLSYQSGDCTGDLSGVAAGIVWAVDHGADVINLSLGVTSPSMLLENATYYAYSHGVVVVAAAGNSGASGLTYPARYPWVLSVGSTNDLNERNTNSSTGAELDLMAPGSNILSTLPTYTLPGSGRNYGILSGTSMSAPHAAAATALLLGYDPARFDHPLKIYEALTATARDLGTPGRDNLTGFGLLDIRAALEYDPTVIPPDPPEADVRYEWLSSRQCQNITFSWVDATTGNVQFITENDGISPAPVNIPFTFTFGGVDYTQLYISANGFLTFDPAILTLPFSRRSETALNVPIPGIALPNQAAMPFWDDLNPSANPSSRIYTTTIGSSPNRRFVVEWYRVPLQGISSSQLTFEAILYEGSNQIRFQYLALDGARSSGSSATIGLEFLNGEDGTQVSYNQPGAVQENDAIHFFPGGAGDDQLFPGCVYSTLVDSGGGFYLMPPFCLEIPPGSIADDSLLRLELLRSVPALPEGYVDLGAYLDITIDPVPNPPLIPQPRVCYNYTGGDVVAAGGHAENLFIAAYSGGRWHSLPTSLDTGAAQIWADANHFSIYGAFANRPEQLPVTGAANPHDEIWYFFLALLGMAYVTRLVCKPAR